MSDKTSPQLVILYQKMADYTKGECANACNIPHSCCDEFYCVIAKQTASEMGVEIPYVDPNAKAPYLGPQGCIVPPHFRPMCTLHTCDIGNLGFKRDDPDGTWTDGYFKIRSEIDEIEMAEERFL